MKYCIDISKLNFTYPKSKNPSLRNLSLRIPEGCYFGLLGPNGAGKTTLISALCGQIRGQYEGATVLGDDWKNIESIKKRIGYAPQEVALYPTLSARENLKFFARFLKVSSSEIDRVLNWIGLTDRANDHVSTFSGGMKRRLNLGVALLGRPQLLILDEPTVGVDPQSRNFIFEKLRELKKENVTVIYSTHYLEEVKKLCDRVGILNRGEILREGTVQDVLGERDLERAYLQLTGDEVEG